MDLNLKAQNWGASPTDERLRSLMGCLAFASLNDALIARGLGWHVTIGAFSTGVTGGGAGTVYDLDQPEAGFSVPSGYALRPLRLSISLQPVTTTTTDADENETLIAVDTGASWYGDGTVTNEYPNNLRTDIARGSPAGTSATTPNSTCPIKVFSAATADLTRDGTNDPVLDMELDRAIITEDNQSAVGIVQSQLRLLYEPLNAPWIVGPACLYLYWGGTVALTGFAQVSFLAVPSALLTTLV